jgi:hypothetical protein
MVIELVKFANHKTHNNALHLMVILLRSIAAGELCRYSVEHANAFIIKDENNLSL